MGIPPRSRPPPGQWNDGLCDCCNNCWPSCYCSFCICNGGYILSQIIEKTRYNGRGNGWSVFNTAIGLFILGIVLIITTILAEVPEATNLCMLPFSFYLIYMGIVTRLYVIEVMGIQGNGCFCECLTACFCHQCSIAQMARHLYGYDPEVSFDRDARMDTPDNWQPMPTGSAPGAAGMAYVENIV